MSASDINPDVTYEEWPASVIAQLLGSGVTDTLPAYTGENKGFQILNDSRGTAVLALVEDGTETAGVNAYLEILATANYVENGKDKVNDTIYTSPNGQIDVTVYYATQGSFTITFAVHKEPAAWPTNDVATAVGKLATDITDVVPALEGADDYKIFEDDDSVQVQAIYSSANAAKAAKADYASTLKTANFTEGGEDKYGDMNYNSPNEQFYINLWYSSSDGYKVILDIYAGKFVPAEKNSSWPANEIAEFMNENNYTDVLPAFNGGVDYIVDADEYEMYIMIEVDDPEQAAEDYADALEEALFEFDSYDDTDGSPYYWSPNEEYLVNPYVSQGGYFVIYVC